jgi:micrococcal nuclease
MDFIVDLGFHLKNTIRVRLKNIDTPELRGENKELGAKVKMHVTHLLMAETVTLRTEKTGSFGRWLGVVTFEDGETLTKKILDKFPELWPAGAV